MSNTFLTVSFGMSCGCQICDARRFTVEEKTHYAEWYQDFGLVSVSDQTDLPYITMRDMPDRAADGAFNGSSNSAWIITQDEAARLISLNAQRAAEETAKRDAETRAEMERIIAAASRQPRLYTREEAQQLRTAWINTYNEGGDGYVPHYYTQNEVADAEAWLASHAPEDPDPAPAGGLIPLAEYAAKIGRSPVSVRQKAARGAIPGAVKIGRDWLIPAGTPYTDNRRKEPAMIIRMDESDFDNYKYILNTPIEVGREYLVIEKTNIRTQKTWHVLHSDTSRGLGGNMDPSIRRYHGWRGTTNDISHEALGVRRVEQITHYKNGTVKIRLSEDLKPDEP